MSTLSRILRHPFVLALVVVVSVTGIGLLLTETLRWKPRMQPMEFSLRQKVSAASALHFSFPQLLDHRSTEQNMTTPSGLNGTWAWEDDVLIFHPTEKLESGRSYTFHLSGATKRQDGQILGSALDFTFTVAGPARVTSRLPAASSTDIPTTAHMTIVFDRPMIPLTQVQGAAAEIRTAAWPVTIAPLVSGRWRWLSTVATAFIPAEGLSPATRYTVSVPKGIPTVAGDATEEDFSWSFETVRPEVVSTTPSEGYTLAGPTTELSLTFNQEMQPALLQESLVLSKGTEDAPERTVDIRSVEFDAKEENEQKVTDRNTLIVVPATPLELASAYMLKIAPGFTGAGGTLGNGSGFTLHFSTVGPFTIVKPRYENYAIVIPFSNPIAEGSLKDQIEISPAVENWEDVTWSIAEWQDNREMTAYPHLSPSTTYTLTLSTGIADTFGQHLTKPETFTFTTAPLPPQLGIASKGPFGIFERGKPPVELVQSVNVSRIDVELSQISLGDFLLARGAHRYVEPTPLPASRTILRSRSITPKHTQDLRETFSLDMQEEAGQSLAAGIYALQVVAPKERNEAKEPLRDTQYFALTDMALTLKYSGDHALVWAIDMRNGAPVAGASIRFHALNGETVLTGKTDAEGFFTSPLPLKKFITPMNEWEPEFWVTAEKGEDFAFVSSQWNDGIRPDSFGFPSDFWNANGPEQRVESFVYTERPLYRGGDSVNFKGIVRLRNRNGRLALPGVNRRVLVTVRDTNGNEIFSKELPFTEYGSFSGSLPIDPKAVLGNYWLSAHLLPESDLSDFGTSFSVLAYRKPEYRVDITTERSDYFNHDTVQATIEGAYYFGAPMDGAHVSWRARTTDYFFNKFTDGWYSFALEDAWCWENCERETKVMSQGEGTLDAAGQFTVRVPVTIDDSPLSQILTLEADITDPNNQVVSNRISVPVHKADVYVGVRTEDYVVTPGQEAKFGVVTVQPDGKPLPSTRVTLELFSRKWNTIRKKGVDGEYTYENTPMDTLLRSLSVTTNADGKATASFLIDKGGEYRVVATVKDNRGREAKAGTSAYAWSSTFINWPHSNNDRIAVVADKPEYAVGDTATLLVKSPYQGTGVKALVTIEREQIIKHRLIPLESSAQTITIPITEDLIPNAYVSVVIVKPRLGETFDEHGLDTGAPAFKIGYAKLTVNKEPKVLTIGVRTDQAEYLPGEKVTVTLTATDWEGKPARAELSLGVVDMSLLALSGFTLPDPVAMFFSDRGIGVYTAEMLKFLIERYKPGSKGGGGSDLERRLRGNFKDTAYWNPTIQTDGKGEATVSFTLPDNLTTWHFLAIGQTREQTFGAAQATAIETKRVIVRPVRPRFAVRGDRITLGAIVHNFFPDSQTFTVTLAGSGFTLNGTASQKITIASGEMTKLSFPVTITAGEKATFRFTAESSSGRDAIEEDIPVFIYGTPQAVATTGIVEKSALEKVLVPSAEDARDGTLSLTVSPSLATYLPKGLKYLATFPYGCAEQTLSSLLPGVVLSRLQGYDAFQFVDHRKLDAIVTAGLERIYTFQRSDGGFGYWQESRRSFPALSAYALFALHQTKLAGYSVDQGIIDRTRAYLEQSLRTQNSKEPLDLATRASILFALAETRKVDVSLLTNLNQSRAKLPLFAKASLAMAFEKAGTSTAKTKAATLLTEILNAAKVDGRGTHFEEEDSESYASLMHTNDRTTAMVLQAILRIDPENALTPNIVRYLLAARKDGHWDTTQSTVYSLLALIDYLKETDELSATYTAGAQVNDTTVLDWEVGKNNVLTRREVTLAFDRLLQGQESTVKIVKNGKGKLYYDLALSYFYTADDLPPAEEGMSIQRSIEPLPGQKKDVTVGNTYRVTLTITVPEERHFVAAESPLPAGMEAIDLSLETAQQTLLSDSTTAGNWWSADYWKSGLWRFSHHEFRDDAVFLFADELPAGVYQYTYLVRATTPGVFHERPAHVWEMYFPETFGQTEGKLFTVKE